MKCPKCNHVDTKVTDTRVVQDGSRIRRRRQCIQCGYRFSTVEVYCKPELLVIKRSGKEEDFDGEKIINGLRKAIRADETSESKIEILMQGILRRIYDSHPTKIATETIGQIVIAELRQIDPIAYLRFASVYKNFHEAHEFEQEFKNLEK
jgi:transcriptional repressor NrdR